MSKVTPRLRPAIRHRHARIELIEANETPAVIIVRWPFKPSVFHPPRFPDAAATAARRFAAASTELSRIKARKRPL